jgi:hypothetical protein
METVQSSSLKLFLRDSASFALFTLGTIIGIFGLAVVADMPAFPGYFQPEWVRVAGIALMGFTALLASIVALHNRRTAGLLLISITPIVGASFAWWLRQNPYDPQISIRRVLLIFTVACLPLAVPGAFWLITARRHWGPTLRLRFLNSHSLRMLAGAVFFGICVSASLLWSLYIPKYAWEDCRQEYAPLSVQRFPDQAVFTADLLFAGGNSFNNKVAAWSLMHVRRQFWGVPDWTFNLVVVKGGLRVSSRKYLIDARRTQGLLTHFLPFFDIYPCCHTLPEQRAVADLRVLQAGPPSSGVRIIGTVYTDMFVTRDPARDLELIISGPSGTVSATTDENGVYDLQGLHPGHYSVQIKSESLHGHWYRAEADLKDGQVWGATLIARKK